MKDLNKKKAGSLVEKLLAEERGAPRVDSCFEQITQLDAVETEALLYRLADYYISESQAWDHDSMAELGAAIKQGADAWRNRSGN